MRILLTCLLLTAWTGLPAADEAALRTQAEALLAAGMTAMKESSATPGRAVDAILLFDRVLAIDRTLGDVDQECDVQANIFWCKKHLDLDQVKAYLAAKGDDKLAEAALAELHQTADQPIAPSEAETYFNRARAYATEHPDRPLQVAIRYFEVAERFQGTSFSLTAQRLSLEAQQQAMAKEAQKQAQQTETLFSKHPAAGDPAAKAPVPAPEALKAATASIKETYKEDYARTRRAQRLALVGTLIAQSTATTGDAAMRYALLDQARELAIAAADPTGLLSASDLLAAGFTGLDDVQLKKQALARIHNLPAASAMIRLLGNPDDADANAVVGRYYGLDLQQWPIALPLLARCGDAALKKLAAMELAAPAVPEHQAEIGDGWYEQSRHAAEPVRDALYARALHWYELAEAGLTGMTKSTTAHRIAELKGLILQEGITDWAHLTAAQWERIRAPVVEVLMTKARNDVPAQAIPDLPCRILPSPADTWHVSAMGQDLAVGAKGDPQRQVGGFQAGELLMALGAATPQSLAEVTQAGPLALMAATSATVGAGGLGGLGGRGGGMGRRGGGGGGGGGGGFGNAVSPGTGVIRVKLLTIEGR